MSNKVAPKKPDSILKLVRVLSKRNEQATAQLVLANHRLEKYFMFESVHFVKIASALLLLKLAEFLPTKLKQELQHETIKNLNK